MYSFPSRLTVFFFVLDEKKKKRKSKSRSSDADVVNCSDYGVIDIVGDAGGDNRYDGVEQALEGEEGEYGKIAGMHNVNEGVYEGIDQKINEGCYEDVGDPFLLEGS